VKRFYAAVTTGATRAGFGILLDGRPVRTPARNELAVPTRLLAEAVAGEWRSQGEQVDPDTMRLTRLATSVVDLMPARRADVVAEAAAYAGTELLCYRATSPTSLVERQADTWQPWLDWAERQYDARLQPVSGIMPAAQSETALKALRAAVDRLDDWRLIGLHAAATLLGSLVLALALERSVITAEGAFAAGLLDELFAIEQWGEDAEQTRRHARLRLDLAAAERFLALLRA
jgi:chaperone required for assembly of F1-ATPase